MPPPSPSIVLLSRGVDTINIQGHILNSGDKRAFGFNDPDMANRLVQELDLNAVLGGQADLSFVTLRGCREYSCVHTVDKNLLLVASAFFEIYPYEVLLIYDAIDRSLRMIPFMPHTLTPLTTAFVLVARRHDDDGRDKSYALVFPGTDGEQEVLFLARSTSTHISPWQTKKAKFPRRSLLDDGLFDAVQVFSFRGRGYWVDLLSGVMYCDCSQVLSDDIDCVDIRSLDLPMGCNKYSGYREDIADAKAFRAMGPVGDPIKFVSIHGYLEQLDLEDCKVRVWTLMPDMNWAVEYELKLASLWVGGDFKGDPVPPEMAPMYPFLCAQEENNVIYFALGLLIRGEKNCFPTKPCHMLRVDLHSKTVKCTELSKSQSAYMTSHLALSNNAADKLLSAQ